MLTNTAALEKRLSRLAIRVIYEVPWLAPVAARCRFIATDKVPTMAVHDDGRIFVNPEYVGKKSDAEAGGVIAHEYMHPLFLHSARRGNRTAKNMHGQDLWNVATDMAINSILRTAGFRLPDEPYFPPYGMEESSAEALYDYLIKNSRVADSYRPDDKPGRGCGCEEGESAGGDQEAEEDGDGDAKGDGEGANAGAGEERPNWEEAAAQAKALARGSAAGNLVAKHLTPPPARTRWSQVIKGAALHAAASHGRDGQTWTRRSRRSPPQVILPGWCAVKARIAVVVDASGSVTDEQLAAASAEIVRMQMQVGGLRVYLVIHDSIVQHEGWVNARTAETVQNLICGRGGTSFDGAYRQVEAQGRFDACVHLTDGEIGTWPTTPTTARRFIVARLGNGGDKAPDGALDIPVIAG